MNENQNGEQAGGLSLPDIYFILFRHKWKIILLSLAGLVGAAVVSRSWNSARCMNRKPS